MLFFFVFFSPGGLKAQSISNYVFSSSTTGSLDPMTGATSLAGTGALLTVGYNDDNASGVVSFGFPFTFMGQVYSQFSANSNGQMRLGSTAIAGTQTAPSSGAALFAPMGGDNSSGRAGDLDPISYVVTGTAPNRILKVQWKNFNIPYSSSNTTTCTMQVWLYEATGVVEYVYGQMYAQGSAPRSVFISSSNTATTVGYITVAATPLFTATTTAITNTFAAASFITDLTSSSNGSRRVYTFTPASTLPANPTNLTFTSVTSTSLTVGFTDNSTNELGFAVIRATDASFTQNVSVTNVATTTSAGTGTAYSSAQSSLSPGTTYYIKVVSLLEGSVSTGLTGTQATTAGTTYYWVGASGQTWNTAANWNTAADGTGTSRTSVQTTDVLIIDGASTTSGGSLVISVDLASFSIGQFKVINNTNCSLQSSITTTRTITLIGGPGDDFVVESGSTLNLIHAANAVAFAHSGSGNTGNIGGTINLGGATGNIINNTGGTGTQVTVQSGGVVNNYFAGTTACFVGSTTNLIFTNGSTYNVLGATTTGVNVPIATWGTSSNLVFSSYTSSTTTFTNNTQSFGNLTYNCPSASATMSMFTSSTTAVIKGNLSVIATNTGILRLLTTGSLRINGNLLVSGGTCQISSSTGTLTVDGNVTVSGGSLDIAQGGASTLRVAGNFLQTGGTIGQTNTGGTLEFNGASTQTFTLLASAHGTNVINVRVNNPSNVNLTAGSLLRNVTISNGNLTGAGSITYGSTSVLTYNSTTGAQTMTAVEFPASSGPASLVINNTAISPANTVTMPFSRNLSASGTLTLTAGILDNQNYTLTLLNSAFTAISGGSNSSYLTGALERTLPASYVTANNWNFPVGKSLYKPFVLVNPGTKSSGGIVVKAEVFDATTGGNPGSLMDALKTNRYWKATITSGIGNLDSTRIQLNDTPNGADAIAYSSSLTGNYDLVGGTTIITTASSLTSTNPGLSNFDGFFVMGTKASASLSNLTISPTGNQCTNVQRTVTVTVTPGGSPISDVTLYYSVNGVAQTPILMYNPSNNDWTADIPTVTPANGTVTWSVTATDANSLTKSLNGTAYTDEPLLGSTAAIAATSNPICSGTPSQLTASLVKSNNGTIGAGGSTLTAAGQSFFSGSWGGVKVQYIIRAAELTAQGISAGRLFTLGFQPTTAGQTYTGFTVHIGHTAQTTMTTTFISTGLTQVYRGTLTNDGYLPVAGTLNTLSFGTGTGSNSSFTWDGTSNIVVQFCWSSVPSASTATGSGMLGDAPGFVCSAYDQADNLTPAAMLASATADNTASSRPRFTFTGNAAPSITSITWNNGTGNFSTDNPITVSPSSATTYTANLVAGGCTTSPSLLISIATPPATPTATSTVSCPGIPTASVASNTSIPIKTFLWYSDSVGGTLLQASSSTTYLQSLAQTDTFYVAEIDSSSGCISNRAMLVAGINSLSIDPGVASFCAGAGAKNTTLDVISSDITFTSFTWSSPTASAVLSSNSGTPINITITETSDFLLEATDGVCTQTATISIGVYDFPTPNLAASPNDTVCLGTQFTVSSGLSAGTFSSSPITAAPRTFIASADTLASGGIAVSPLSSGDLDDGGWANVPLGFNFNFFGTSYNSVNVGTNGVLQFGAYNGASLGDFTYTTLPSASEPFNIVAVLANDMILSTGSGQNGTIRYWTEGYAPNRKFVVEYYQVRQYNNANLNTAQAIFYETTGVIEVHVTSAASTNNKVIGINNSNGTIGALALASTAAISSPIAYRFSPPSNYTTTWSPAGILTGTINGTNIFSATTNISSAGTSQVELVLTNQVTGCSNAASPATIDLVVISPPVAPITVDATACGSGSGILSVSNAGAYSSTDTIKWYSAATGGVLLGYGNTFTTPILNDTVVYYVEVYNGICNSGARVPATMFVNPADPIAVVSNGSTPVCLGSSADLEVTQAASNNTYSLTWTASDYVNSGLSSSTSASLSSPITITPTAVGTYYFVVTGIETGSGCTTSAYDTITVINPFGSSTKFASASPSALCSGNPTNLTAVVGVQGTSTIGSQTTTEFGGSVYRYGFGTGDFRHQLVYSAVDLNAAGLVAGNLTSIGFNVTGAGSGSGSNYTISLASVPSAGSLTSTFFSGTLTQVYTTASYTPVSGWNTHTFNTPYFWDGTSDIIVNICYSVATTGGSATVAATTPSGISNVNLLGSAGACSATTGTTYANRPLARFGGITGSPFSSISWSDGSTAVGSTNPLTVSPSTSTLYTATINISGCTDTAQVQVNVTPSPSAPSVTPSSHCGTQVPTCSATGGSSGQYRWYDLAVGGTAFSGETNGTLSSYLVSSSTTLYVSVNDGTCEGPRTPVAVTVTIPDQISAGASSLTACNNASLSLSVSKLQTNNTYSYTWTASPAAGSGIPTTASGSLSTPTSITPTAVGNYTYTITGVESSTGCQAVSTIGVTVIDPFAGVTANAISAASAVCSGSPVNLTARTFSAVSGDYTPPSAVTSPTTDEDIDSVAISQAGVPVFTNTTTRNSLVGTLGTATGTAGSYSNFTSFGPFTLTAGQSYQISLRSNQGSNSYENIFGAWIDYNRDGDFTDAGEQIFISSSGLGNILRTGPFTVPDSASNGIVRLRVLNVEASSVSGPTQTVGYGEWEEYSLEITGGSSNVGGYSPATITYSWSDGSTTVGTSNPQSVSPTTATTYTPTLTSSGCVIVGTPVTVGILQPTTTPSAPTLVSVTSGSLDISWTAVANATDYRLDVATDAGFTSFVSGYNNKTIAGTTETVGGLSVGTTYYVRLRASNSCGASSNSTTLTTITLSSAPVLANASAVSATGMTINWNASTGAASYKLDLATDNAFTSFVSGYQDLTVSGTSQAVTGLTAATRYYYRVRAVNASGTSGNSLTGDTITLSGTVGLSLTAFFEGLYLGSSTMTAAPYNSDNLLPDTIADTITVVLHDDITFDSLYAWRGPISTSGLALANFPGAVNGNDFYIAIRHRNSIETWSAAPVTFGSNTSYDFSTASTQAYGDNMANGGSGVYLIFTGDINQDGSVDFLDYPDLDVDALNGELGYLVTDLNGDSSVDFLDYPSIDLNALNGVIMMRP